MYVLTHSTPLDRGYVFISRRSNIIQHLNTVYAPDAKNDGASCYWVVGNRYRLVGYFSKNKFVKI